MLIFWIIFVLFLRDSTPQTNYIDYIFILQFIDPNFYYFKVKSLIVIISHLSLIFFDYFSFFKPSFKHISSHIFIFIYLQLIHFLINLLLFTLNMNQKMSSSSMDLFLTFFYQDYFYFILNLQKEFH